MGTFEERLSNEVQTCEEIISKYLPAEEGYNHTLLEAMNYSVLAGGKRLRPMFILETARMYGGKAALYEPFMAALEMIHTYSLVHDDLPAMDNDEYRRGRKTTWNVYGEDMAVIAGDGLLNLAFETALTAYGAAETVEEKDRVVRALQVLASNAGAFGMVGGQCVDIETDKHPQDVTEDMLRYIHKNKTACLIDSGLAIGAILAGAPEEDVERLHKAATDVGLAFQIEDDILDVVGSKEELGKSIGKDAAEGKVTYVSMHGIDGARAKAAELTNDALQQMDTLTAEDSEERSFLRALLESLTTRTH